MAEVYVLDAVAFMVVADSTVTAPDGNTWTAIANTPYGIPSKQGEYMTVDAGDVLIMLRGSHLKKSSGSFVQVFTTDEVRQSA